MGLGYPCRNLRVTAAVSEVSEPVLEKPHVAVFDATFACLLAERSSNEALTRMGVFAAHGFCSCRSAYLGAVWGYG